MVRDQEMRCTQMRRDPRHDSLSTIPEQLGLRPLQAVVKLFVLPFAQHAAGTTPLTSVEKDILSAAERQACGTDDG
jgi:hypothetical protein